MRKIIEKPLHTVVKNFQIEGDLISFQPISVGLINETYQVSMESKSYVLQRINDQVFKSPARVMENIESVALYLEHKNYPRKILKPIQTNEGKAYHQDQNRQFWRLFPFFENTITCNKIDNPDLAYSAAFAFGEHTRYLGDFDQRNLHITIPDFHHTPLRYQHFEKALSMAEKERLKCASLAIRTVKDFSYILKAYDHIQSNLRVVHYDTKINNLLLDENNLEPVCVIDLDTLMPGMLPYDFGDMVRTFTPPVDENDPDIKQVIVREPIFEAVRAGFLAGMRDQIRPEEKKYLNEGAKLIIFEQALRFLTDYLLGDTYYAVTYSQQNLIRANNQLALLKDFLNKANQ